MKTNHKSSSDAVALVPALRALEEKWRRQAALYNEPDYDGAYLTKPGAIRSIADELAALLHAAEPTANERRERERAQLGVVDFGRSLQESAKDVAGLTEQLKHWQHCHGVTADRLVAVEAEKIRWAGNYADVVVEKLRLEAERTALRARVTTLMAEAEEFTGWWGLNREGSINRAYDHIDKTVKRLSAACADLSTTPEPHEPPRVRDDLAALIDFAQGNGDDEIEDAAIRMRIFLDGGVAALVSQALRATTPEPQAAESECVLANLNDNYGPLCITHDATPDWVECTGWRCEVSGLIIKRTETEEEWKARTDGASPEPQEKQP